MFTCVFIRLGAQQLRQINRKNYPETDLAVISGHAASGLITCSEFHHGLGNANNKSQLFLVYIECFYFLYVAFIKDILIFFSHSNSNV